MKEHPHAAVSLSLYSIWETVVKESTHPTIVVIVAAAAAAAVAVIAVALEREVVPDVSS